MAVCVVIDNPNESAELFDKVERRLAESRATPPAGGIFSVAGPTDDGWRMISVWDSQESLERFQEGHLFPILQEVGVAREGMTVSVFEVHSYMAGDLGASRQAG